MRLGSMLAGQISAAIRALDAAVARLDADKASSHHDEVGKRTLRARSVSLDGPRPAMDRARNLAIRMAASPVAGGPLFDAVLEQAGYSSDLVSNDQRSKIASLIKDIRLVDLPPRRAELFTRAALRAAANHVLGSRSGIGERHGSDAVAKGIADCAIEQAVSAYKSANKAEAAGWLVDGTVAIGGGRGYATGSTLDAKTVISNALVLAPKDAVARFSEGAAREISLMLDDIDVWTEAERRLANNVLS